MNVHRLPFTIQPAAHRLHTLLSAHAQNHRKRISLPSIWVTPIVTASFTRGRHEDGVGGDLKEAGDTQAAVAMCLLILATNLLVRLLDDAASPQYTGVARVMSRLKASSATALQLPDSHPHAGQPRYTSALWNLSDS